MKEKRTSEYSTAFQQLSASQKEIVQALARTNDKIRDSIQRFIHNLPTNITKKLPSSLLLEENVPRYRAADWVATLFLPQECRIVEVAHQYMMEWETADGVPLGVIPFSTPLERRRNNVESPELWIQQGPAVMACLSKTLTALQEGKEILSAEDELAQLHRPHSYDCQPALPLFLL